MLAFGSGLANDPPPNYSSEKKNAAEVAPKPISEDMLALAALHRRLDDDANGNVDRAESDEVRFARIFFF